MKTLQTPHEFQHWRKTIGKESVGFVPTMGALHLGHQALLQKSKAENDLSVLSIFVNPTQFNDPNDFSKYPKTWEADLAIAQNSGVDVLFAPNRDEMYPDQYKFKVIETDFSKQLCGQNRPGHFDGVLSVVMKLFCLVQPQKAYFGEKDFQQLKLIQDMASAFFLPLEVIGVPTVREADGLAMSSRNTRLTHEQRERAPQIYRIISRAADAASAQIELSKQGFKVDYVSDLFNRRFAAAHLGEVRLIDNVELKK